MKILFGLFGLAVVSSIITSFYIMFRSRQNQQGVCPANTEADYNLVSRYYPKPSFTIQDLRKVNYDVHQLVSDYVQNTLSKVDDQSVTKIKMMSAVNLNQQVKRLQGQFTKIVGQYSSLLKMQSQLYQLNNQFGEVNCNLPSVNQIQSRHNKLKRAQLLYNKSYELLPKQIQTTNLNDLLYKKAQYQAQIKVLQKKLNNIQIGGQRKYLSVQEKKILINRKTQININIHQLQPKVNRSVVQLLNKLNLYRRQKALLQLQIHQIKMHQECNTLYALIKNKDNITQQSLNQAIQKYNRMGQTFQYLNDGTLQNIMKNFTQKTNKSYEQTKKQLKNEMRIKQQKLKQKTEIINILQNQLNSIDQNRKIASTSIKQLNKELNHIQIKLLTPVGPFDNTKQSKELKDKIQQTKNDIKYLQINIFKIRKQQIQPKAHSNQLYRNYKAQQTAYKEQLQQFSKFFRNVQSAINDCKILNNQAQQKKKQIQHQINSYRQGWNRLMQQIKQANQTLTPLANI